MEGVIPAVCAALVVLGVARFVFYCVGQLPDEGDEPVRAAPPRRELRRPALSGAAR